MTVFFKAENAMLTDYIKYLFPQGETDGPYVVKSSHTFGELLISHIRESERPVLPPSGDNVIELSLPLSNATQYLSNKFIYYSASDMLRLNCGLKALFDIDFQTFYLKAEGLGFTKKEIIETFITSRKLVDNDPYEALHKRVYRREQEKRARISKFLLRKVYYLYESLDITGLKAQ